MRVNAATHALDSEYSVGSDSARFGSQANGQHQKEDLTMTRKTVLAVVFLGLCTGRTASAEIIHVPTDYPTIQSAINAPNRPQKKFLEISWADLERFCAWND